MIGNNSCGTHSLISGKTVDNVHELRILLYDGTELTVGATSEAELDAIVRDGGRRGEIYAALRSIRDRYLAHIRSGFPQIPRRVSGYNLDQLLPENGFHVARALVGTEGTCAIVLGATVRLIDSPQHVIVRPCTRTHWPAITCPDYRRRRSASKVRGRHIAPNTRAPPTWSFGRRGAGFISLNTCRTIPKQPASAEVSFEAGRHFGRPSCDLNRAEAMAVL